MPQTYYTEHPSFSSGTPDRLSWRPVAPVDISWNTPQTLPGSPRIGHSFQSYTRKLFKILPTSPLTGNPSRQYRKTLPPTACSGNLHRKPLQEGSQDTSITCPHGKPQLETRVTKFQVTGFPSRQVMEGFCHSAWRGFLWRSLSRCFRHWPPLASCSRYPAQMLDCARCSQHPLMILNTNSNNYSIPTLGVREDACSLAQ